MNWYDCLPPAEASLPCGDGTHVLRWEAGRLSLPAHPDAEAELILGALGGGEPACLTLAQTWDRHLGDLTVLTAGPRGHADTVPITWDQVERLRTSSPAAGRFSGTGTSARARASRSGPHLPRTLGYSAGRAAAPGGTARWRAAPGRADGELATETERRFEVLRLMALGPAFQFRLSGAVAASWAADSRAQERSRHQPALAAALTSRFAPVAAEWLGIDPAAVTITPHEGPGWGSLTLTGTRGTSAAGDADRDQRLTGSLPVRWLSEVWACGLALTDGHLTVAVEQGGCPHARVLALPAPGAAPVSLDVNR
jgi:hypothetical protein